jgi:hypothetical protein
VWETENLEWPVEYDDTFDRTLPPQEQVLYCMLRKIFKANIPQKKTASVSALLALVARGARKVCLLFLRKQTKF